MDQACQKRENVIFTTNGVLSFFFFFFFMVIKIVIVEVCLFYVRSFQRYSILFSEMYNLCLGN